PPASADAAHFSLLVKPDGVEVLVDRQLMTVIDGKVEISGAPGSVHSVRLSLNGKTLEQSVAVTAGGLLPQEVSLPVAAPAVAPVLDSAPRTAAPVALGRPGAAAAVASKKGASAPSDKPDTKPKPTAKATGLSEKTDEF
ncbi:MAG TPA: hypothetical protein VGM29_09990, partial [Polyangiaceae bacterium]